MADIMVGYPGAHPKKWKAVVKPLEKNFQIWVEHIHSMAKWMEKAKIIVQFLVGQILNVLM